MLVLVWNMSHNMLLSGLGDTDALMMFSPDANDYLTGRYAHDASHAIRLLEAKELSIHIFETNERTATRPEWVV